MGSGASTNNIEVSFIDNETGKMMEPEMIEKISDEAVELEREFYRHFSDPAKLEKMREEWLKGEEIRGQNINWFVQN